MFFKFKHLSAYPQIKHFVSLRNGGVSKKPYDSLNIGFGTDDLPENVLKNRQIIAKELQIPLEQWVVPQQTHSTHILSVGRQEQGKGAFSKTDALPDTDALLSNERSLCLVVQSADCVCSLYYDPKNQVIGAVHAGWRGAVGLLPQKMIVAMQKTFGSQPRDMVVGVGACIGSNIYEIGAEVAEAVEYTFGTKENYLLWNARSQKYHLNLRFLHQKQLQEAGVLEAHIEIMQDCTYLNSFKFFSARRDKNTTGRFSAGIMLV